MSTVEENLAILQQLLANNRTLYYLEYSALTGSDQANEQAMISNFSGAIGGAALWANYRVAEEASSAGLTVLPIKDFSIVVANFHFAAVQKSQMEGGGGILTDLQAAEAAHDAWVSVGLGDYSIPGAARRGDTHFCLKIL